MHDWGVKGFQGFFLHRGCQGNNFKNITYTLKLYLIYINFIKLYLILHEPIY